MKQTVFIYLLILFFCSTTLFAQKPEIIKVKGRGLMLGVEFDFDVSALRKKMIIEKHIFTGGSSNKNLLRILPPLTITTAAIDTFIVALQESLAELK